MVERQIQFIQRTRDKEHRRIERPVWIVRGKKLVQGVMDNLGLDHLELGIPRHTRREGIARLDCTYDPTTKNYWLNLIVFDSKLRNAESLRRLEKMLEAAESDAKKLGAKTIVTRKTWITPSFARKKGYSKLYAGNGLYGENYGYKKEIG